MEAGLGSGALARPRTTVTFFVPAFPKARTSTLGTGAPDLTLDEPLITFTGTHRGFPKVTSRTSIVCPGLKPGNRGTPESKPPAGSPRAARVTQHANATDASIAVFMAAPPWSRPT